VADAPSVLESPNELLPEDLGARLRAVRELTGANQRDVAKAAGLSRRELQSAERGAKRLTDDELRALAGALGVEPDVLVGVGFEDTLGRAGSVEDRIDQFIGHDPDAWDDLPMTADDLPPALPVELPNPERRRDLVTRERIEQSWRDTRAQMSDVLTSCARLVSAGSGDDVRRIIERLENDLRRLKSQHKFLRNLADHERALERAREQHRRDVSTTTAGAPAEPR
jgi:transcriptional regulator with XRE-family HTH domain